MNKKFIVITVSAIAVLGVGYFIMKKLKNKAGNTSVGKGEQPETTTEMPVTETFNPSDKVSTSSLSAKEINELISGRGAAKP
jgi:hypothetical protein